LNVTGEEFGEAGIRATLAATARLTSHEIRDEIVQRRPGAKAPRSTMT
jgi:hypothetical protein